MNQVVGVWYLGLSIRLFEWEWMKIIFEQRQWEMVWTIL